MGVCYEKLIRPVLFRLDPERAHELGVSALATLGSIPFLASTLARINRSPANTRPIRVFGLDFPNRVGLAAGFDKNGTAWRGAAALGFGHVEVGTVTRHRQPGNPRPRVFRFPDEKAVINRMGFNNCGADAMAARFARLPPPGRRPIPVGINIGKSKITPLDEAVEDYLYSFGLLADYADYMVVNVSSPNTPDLRKLQHDERLAGLLAALAAANNSRAESGKTKRPLLVKIAPDLTFAQVDQIIETALDLGLDGIIATNTTLARPGALSAVHQDGGLSGRPLRARSTQMISYIARATGGRLPIIGVGGIDDAESAGEKLDAGASLVQVYTGFIYRGAWLPKDLSRSLADSHRA